MCTTNKVLFIDDSLTLFFPRKESRTAIFLPGKIMYVYQNVLTYSRSDCNTNNYTPHNKLGGV